MAGGYRSEDDVHRTRFTMGERLLRKLQLEDARRGPQRRDLLLDEGLRVLAERWRKHYNTAISCIDRNSEIGALQ